MKDPLDIIITVYKQVPQNGDIVGSAVHYCLINVMYHILYNYKGSISKVITSLGNEHSFNGVITIEQAIESRRMK
jgi:hypothetical protein